MRAPAVSAARDISEAAIVAQVGNAIIDSRYRLSLADVAIAVVTALFVPIVVWRHVYVLREKISGGIGVVESESFSFANLNLSERGAGHSQITLEDRDIYAIDI